MTEQDAQELHEYKVLIDRYIDAGDGQRIEIAAEIERRFSVETTILVLDISGFTRLTSKFGIVHYLSMIRRMQLLTTSIITDHQGEIIKFEADNLFAHFPDVDAAIGFSLDVLQRFRSMNVSTNDHSDIYASIGIASGSVLVLEHRDAWGSTMNLASKLGEDLAEKDEVLVHEDAFSASRKKSFYATERLELMASGISIPARKIRG